MATGISPQQAWKNTLDTADQTKAPSLPQGGARFATVRTDCHPHDHPTGIPLQLRDVRTNTSGSFRFACPRPPSAFQYLVQSATQGLWPASTPLLRENQNKTENDEPLPPPPPELRAQCKPAQTVHQLTCATDGAVNPSRYFTEAMGLPPSRLAGAWGGSPYKSTLPSEAKAVLTVGKLPFEMVYSCSGLAKHPVPSTPLTGTQEKKNEQRTQQLTQWVKCIAVSKKNRALVNFLVSECDADCLRKLSVLIWKIQTVQAINGAIEKSFKKNEKAILLALKLPRTDADVTLESVLRCKEQMFDKLLAQFADKAGQASVLLKTDAEQWKQTNGVLKIDDYQILQQAINKYSTEKSVKHATLYKAVVSDDSASLKKVWEQQKGYLNAINVKRQEESEEQVFSENDLKTQLQQTAVCLCLVLPVIAGYIREKKVENSGDILFQWPSLTPSDNALESQCLVYANQIIAKLATAQQKTSPSSGMEYLPKLSTPFFKRKTRKA